MRNETGKDNRQNRNGVKGLDLVTDLSFDFSFLSFVENKRRLEDSHIVNTIMATRDVARYVMSHISQYERAQSLKAIVRFLNL